MNAKLSLELLWWVLTAFVTLAVLYPIYTQVTGYPFYVTNIIFIVSAITLTRYIFLLPYTFLAHLQWVKAALIFFAIPAIFLLIQELNQFQVFLDEQGIGAVVGNDLPLKQQETMVSYIRNEMLLFGMASVVSAVLFPFRMLMSVWRFRNRGTV